MRRGPWPKPVTERLVDALDTLTRRLRDVEEVAALLLFGSYARGEFGRSSDVDLLVLLDTPAVSEASAAAAQRELERTVLQHIGEIEAEARLPMHLSPLLVGTAGAADMSPQLLHNVRADGIVLYARASALPRIEAEGLTAWVIVRFSAAQAAAHERVKLSRRLHGMSGRPGILKPPAVELGRGALLLPADQRKPVCDALDEAGAMYDVIPVWRE